MDILEKDILDSFSIVQEKKKDPTLNLFFSIHHLLVLEILRWKLLKKVLNYLSKSKVVNRKTEQGLDSFFIVDCQLEPEISFSISSPSCLQKGTANETFVCQGKPSNVNNRKTLSLRDYNIKDVTARVVVVKAFLMNKIYDPKQEIQSLKQSFCVIEDFSSNKNENNAMENLQSVS